MSAFADSSHKKSSTSSLGQEVRSNSVAARTTISAFKGNRTLEMRFWRFPAVLLVESTDISELRTVVQPNLRGRLTGTGHPYTQGGLGYFVN